MRKKVLKEELNKYFISSENLKIQAKDLEGAKKRIWLNLSHSIFNYDKNNMQRINTPFKLKILKLSGFFSIFMLILTLTVLFTPLKSKARDLFKIFEKGNMKVIVDGDMTDEEAKELVNSMDFNVEKLQITDPKILDKQQIIQKITEMNNTILENVNVENIEEMQKLLDEKKIILIDKTYLMEDFLNNFSEDQKENYPKEYLINLVANKLTLLDKDLQDLMNKDTHKFEGIIQEVSKNEPEKVVVYQNNNSESSEYLNRVGEHYKKAREIVNKLNF